MVRTKNKKIIITAIALIFTVAIIIPVAFHIHSQSVYKKYANPDLDNLDLDGIDNLMIIAHPDDEMIWGGVHLLEDKYLVVCVTAGHIEARCKELQSAMKQTDDKVVMLGYPDKTFGKRDNWKKCKKDIEKDINKIIGLKDWKTIVTHNPDGEYGHQHHKMTNQIVTKVFKENYRIKDNLYYFGKYYSHKKIDSVKDTLHEQNSDLVEQKIKIIEDTYKTQGFVTKDFGQMYPYEEWTKYKGD